MFATVGYEPNCRPQIEAREQGIDIEACGQCPQERFHAATDWDVLYGGAMGGGKTVALLMEGMRACVRWPGIEVWAFRATYRQLQGSIVKELRLKADLGKPFGATWREQEMDLRFPNGSWFRFLHAANHSDAQDYYSQECQLLLLDERQLMDPAIVDNLMLRVRSGNPNIPVLGVRSGANPGGIGHGVLRSRYIRPEARKGTATVAEITVEPTGDQVIDPIDPRTGDRGRRRRFIPAKKDDNFHLNDDYDETFTEIETRDPELARAMRDGNWDLFSGQIFTEWDPDVHVVRPEDWPISLGGVVRGMAVDYGLDHPFCALWGAVTADGMIVVYREAYERGLTPEEQADLILSMEARGERQRGRPLPCWIDPMTYRRDPSQPVPAAAGVAPKGSIADRYNQSGVPVRRANNDRLLGLAEIHNRLRLRADGMPRIVIYSTCFNLIRTLPEIQRDPARPEDALKTDGDDPYDTLRYLVLGLAGKSSKGEPDVHRGRRTTQAVTGGLAKSQF